MKKIIGLVMVCILLVITFNSVIAADLYGEIRTESDVELFLPDTIDREIAMLRGHTERVVASEKGLNTMLYRNNNNTYTQYVFDYPVKYIDANGQIKDVDLKIREASDSFIAEEGNYNAIFNKSLNKGIVLCSNDVTLEMYPYNSTEKDNIAKVDLSKQTGKLVNDKTISYFADNKTSFEYSLTYTGIKEDIVVSEYTGETKYSFILKTNGLKLTNQDGRLSIKDEKENMLAFLGEVIVFTSDEKNNCFGSMTYDTIKENEIYLVNIHVDKNFLSDENTKYPIKIDPSIEINYFGSGMGAIEDITINSSGTSSGTSGSLYIGKRSGTGIARTLMKFPGLDMSGIASSDRITNATVEIRDLMCESTMMTVDCNIFAGNEWNENSASWQNVDPNYYTGPISSCEVSYSNGTKQSPNHRYKFDITSAVKSWKNGFYTQSKGIMFKATSEVESDSAVLCKTFASYNRSDYRPSLSVTYLADEDLPYGWFDWTEPSIKGWVWNQNNPNYAYNIKYTGFTQIIG